jgi:hypothetical protein
VGTNRSSPLNGSNQNSDDDEEERKMDGEEMDVGAFIHDKKNSGEYISLRSLRHEHINFGFL